MTANDLFTATKAQGWDLVGSGKKDTRWYFSLFSFLEPLHSEMERGFSYSNSDDLNMNEMAPVKRDTNEIYDMIL